MIGSRPGFNPQYRQNFSVGIFLDLSTLKYYNWIVRMVKSDLKDNRPPGTVACAVIPQLGRLALWIFGLVPRLSTLCEQRVNSDQSLMDEEILGAIYLGIKEDILPWNQ